MYVYGRLTGSLSPKHLYYTVYVPRYHQEHTANEIHEAFGWLILTHHLPSGHFSHPNSVQHNKNLGGGFKHFLCSPLPGEMFQFD